MSPVARAAKFGELRDPFLIWSSAAKICKSLYSEKLRPEVVGPLLKMWELAYDVGGQV